MRKVLEAQDYQVLEAKDGEEGLSICQEKLAEIDLVVTDFAMPRLTGLQLKEKVLALHPDMKFLLVTGYADVVDSVQENINGGDFLEKPFPPGELARKVREMLNRINAQEAPKPSSDQLSRGTKAGTTHG